MASDYLAWIVWGMHESSLSQAERHNSMIESDQPQERNTQ
jgi:hypothetical protein